MSEEWLIDGYNLIHDIKSSRGVSYPFLPPSLVSGGAPSREVLCSVLAGFAAFKKTKVRMVLDGVGNPEELQVHTTIYFQAVYSQKVSADHYIEKFIYDNKAITAFVVVTNDRTITEMARGGGARVLKNSQFLEMLKETGVESKAALHKEDARSHGFNRPFEHKFKAKGL